MQAVANKPSVSILAAAKGVGSAVVEFFVVLRAASAVAGALEVRRQPAAEDLRALGLADLKFNYRS